MVREVWGLVGWAGEMAGEPEVGVLGNRWLGSGVGWAYGERM